MTKLSEIEGDDEKQAVQAFAWGGWLFLGGLALAAIGGAISMMTRSWGAAALFSLPVLGLFGAGVVSFVTGLVLTTSSWGRRP